MVVVGEDDADFGGHGYTGYLVFKSKVSVSSSEIHVFYQFFVVLLSMSNGTDCVFQVKVYGCS